jgi:hypothetical protein
VGEKRRMELIIGVLYMKNGDQLVLVEIRNT